MKTRAKLVAVAIFLLSTPLAAYADTIPHVPGLYALGGGFAGSLLGALSGI